MALYCRFCGLEKFRTSASDSVRRIWVDCFC
jgi:hypothetical protein